MGKTAQYLAKPVHYVPEEPMLIPGIEETPEYRAEKAAIITQYYGAAADGREFFQLAILLTASSSGGCVDSKPFVQHSADSKRGTFHFPEECTCED